MKHLLLFTLFSSAIGYTTISDLGTEKQVARTMIFELDSKLTCFFEPLKEGQLLKVNLRTHRSSDRMLQIRTTSPSGELSDWQSGNTGVGAMYNVSETGDYEICVHSTAPCRVGLTLFFYDQTAVEKAFSSWLEQNDLSNSVQERVSNIFKNFYLIKYGIRFYNSISGRDEDMQASNSEAIKNFSVVFCVISVSLAFIQVYLVRKMFRVDEKRIRI